MVESTHILAIMVSLAATLALASQSLFIRVGTVDGKPYDAVLTVLVVNMLVLLPVVSILYYPDHGLTRLSWGSFIAAGVFGTLLGRVLTYMSINKIGASRTSPIIASWALISTILGVFVLDESLTATHIAGIVLIVSGVIAITWETSQENPEELPRRELLVGLIIPLAAAVTFALEPIFVKFGLGAGTPALVGLLVKTAAAMSGIIFYLHWRDQLPNMTVLRSDAFRWFILAGIMNTLFVLSYYSALSIAPVSVVSPILVTTTLFVLLLSALFMPERLERVTWRLAVSAAIVVIGLGFISLAG